MRFPRDSYTSTERKIFQIGGPATPASLVHSYLDLKAACALANHGFGRLPRVKTRAIIEAIARLRRIQPGSRKWHSTFAIGGYQPGAGTALNMNVNEAIALLAGLEPNDDVNASQSSNDTYPTAVRIAALRLIPSLETALDDCINRLNTLARKQRGILKPGRTHLQDAVPIDLSEQWLSHARTLEKCARWIHVAATGLRELPLGGTAVGTGTNAPRGFRRAAIAELARITGMRGLRPAIQGLELQASHLDLAALAGSLELLAVSLLRIGSDLRLQASGPRTGLGELKLPELLPGSSIMPGKINPGALECLHQFSLDAIALATQARWAESMGQFELNVMLPAFGPGLIHQLEAWPRALRLLSERVLAGVRIDRERMSQRVRDSEQWATLLTPRHGYAQVASWVRQARAAGMSFMDWLSREKPEISAEILPGSGETRKPASPERKRKRSEHQQKNR